MGIKNLLQEPRFVRSLKKAARITARTGHEAGFQIWKEKKGKKFYFGKILEGECLAVNTASSLLDLECLTKDERKRFEQAGVFEECTFDFADVHFHPGGEGVIFPSFADLVDFVNYCLIGMVDYNGKISLLIIQKGTADRFSLETAIDKIREMSRDLPAKYQREVNDILREAGFRVTFISWGEILITGENNIQYTGPLPSPPEE